MNNITISPVKFDTLVNEVVDILPKRTKIVIARRFGLKNGKHETLEAIGQDYGITRERVRQIENDALKQLSRDEVLQKFEPAFQYLQDHFKEYGHVRAEQRVLEHLSGAEHPHPKRQAILFVLTIGDAFVRESESDQYHTHWTTDQEAKKKMAAMLDHLVSAFEAEHRLYTEEELRSSAKSFSNADTLAVESYMDVSREIQRNAFGDWGLAEWPEISPRGVRDKAYLVMRKEGKPLHFSDITERINDAKFTNRKAYVQTVHNELIKDQRFVLVGRGLYALSDWGYAPGTVRDILVQVLKESGPLSKEDVLEKAMQRRMVRPNTILLNLQNPKFFIKTQDGRYAVTG